MKTPSERLYAAVLEQLLDSMDTIVKHYPQGVGHTGRQMDDLVQGSAFFPVGPGAKCGDCNGVSLPRYFPEAPTMFIAHNWGNQRMLDKARQNSGEATDTCWVRLMDFLREAGLDPQNCFFTNALMGIKAGSAAGDMPHDPDYRKECEQYLIKQIEIVHPSRIVSLGNASRLLCGKVYKQSGLKTEMINIMHPSARPVNWGGAYEEWVRKQAERIGESILITPPPKPA